MTDKATAPEPAPLTKAEIEAILKFLLRVDLNGREVETHYRCQQRLMEQIPKE